MIKKSILEDNYNSSNLQYVCFKVYIDELYLYYNILLVETRKCNSEARNENTFASLGLIGNHANTDVDVQIMFKILVEEKKDEYRLA